MKSKRYCSGLTEKTGKEFEHIMKKLLNISYGAMQGTYWMYFGAIMSFASVFLLGKNYTNSEIGVILAVSSILAVILQPPLADAADKARKASLADITGMITIGLLAATVFLFFFPTKSLVLSILFILIGTWLTSLQPLLNSMAFYFSGSGYGINFGITRSVGSVAYAVLCGILGSLVTAFGITAIPAAGLVVLALFLFSLIITDRLYKRSVLERETKAHMGRSMERDEAISLNAFVRRNKFFIIFTIGIIFVFFPNSVLNTYLMQIMMDVWGTSSQMGRLFSFMALLELPGLIFFSRLRKRFDCQFMLKVSSIAFVGKIFFTYTASSVAMIYAAFLFQLISFPIFLSASVHLVDEVMERGEAVKGQSLITGMMTLSNVFASLIGGIILDYSGASQLLLISTILCVIGAFIIVVSVGKIKSKRA